MSAGPKRPGQRSFSRKCPGAPKVLWQENLPPKQGNLNCTRTPPIPKLTKPLHISQPYIHNQEPRSLDQKALTLLTAGTPNCMQKLLKPCPCYPVPSTLSCPSMPRDFTNCLRPNLREANALRKACNSKFMMQGINIGSGALTIGLSRRDPQTKHLGPLTYNLQYSSPF